MLSTHEIFVEERKEGRRAEETKGKERRKTGEGGQEEGEKIYCGE